MVNQMTKAGTMSWGDGSKELYEEQLIFQTIKQNSLSAILTRAERKQIVITISFLNILATEGCWPICLGPGF